MNIVIFGAGNVAAVLGRKFVAAGHQIVQIVARNASEASELAYEWDTESANYLSLVNPNADFYLIAVSDNAIAEIAAELKLPGKVVAHTAASVPADVLKNVTAHYGVLYPLQSLRKDTMALPDIPIYVNGNDEKAMKLLTTLAKTISVNPPIEASDEERKQLHVAAVFVSNFVNHLYTVAEKYCKEEGLDFSQLFPLIEETATRIKKNKPAEMQTGPAIRHDESTIAQHRELLTAYPQWLALYDYLTKSIQENK